MAQGRWNTHRRMTQLEYYDPTPPAPEPPIVVSIDPDDDADRIIPEELPLLDEKILAVLALPPEATIADLQVPSYNEEGQAIDPETITLDSAVNQAAQDNYARLPDQPLESFTSVESSPMPELHSSSCLPPFGNMSMTLARFQQIIFNGMEQPQNQAMVLAPAAPVYQGVSPLPAGFIP